MKNKTYAVELTELQVERILECIELAVKSAKYTTEERAAFGQLGRAVKLKFQKKVHNIQKEPRTKDDYADGYVENV